MKSDVLNRTYGCPTTPYGKLDRQWYRENIVPVTLPYPMRVAWQKSIRVCTVLFHRKKAEDLFGALGLIHRYARLVARTRSPRANQAQIEQLALKKIQDDGLDLLGGAYCFRKTRDGSSLSTHALGIAIDIDPLGNPPGVSTFKMPEYAVRAFHRKGFTWSGNRKRKRNAMHFQASD